VTVSKDSVARRTVPRLVVLSGRLDGRAKLGARARRALGRRGRVELFLAFDDAVSAYALIDLADRVAGRDVQLAAYPVVRRGIPDDPAMEDKRSYAVEDAGRLGRRRGLVRTRTRPIAPEETAFLAAWVAAAPATPARLRFAVAAAERLWFADADGPVDRDAYAALWRAELGGDPLAGDAGDRAVRANERRMARRGPYDTPAAWVHGQWFFAQDRGPQIAARLDDLGWTVAA